MTKRPFYYSLGQVAVFIVLMAVFGLVFIMWAANNMPPTKTVCYDGYSYRVDRQGVMWPIQMKYGVKTCKPGADDVVSK